jgi:hypothetical protein
VDNQRIFAGEKSFDIGCRVLKWDEPGGLDLTPYKKYSTKKGSFEDLSKQVRQFTVHWSVTYTAKSTFTGIQARALSANFIMGDDDINGYSSIYQCLDLFNFGWSQGDRFNTIGYGVEMSYMPDLFNGVRYTPEIISKYKVQPHESTSAPIHGTKLKVYLPTKAQMNSLVQLIWGITELFPNIKPEFPKNNGNYITTKINNPENYSGLLSHYHLTKDKIDTAGLDYYWIEKELDSRKRLGY